jgi:LysR family glycine cleavage system transcriptional activator
MNTLPPLRALQIFEAIGHSSNLAEAARRLQITPGAISQQIKLLEEALNASLTFKDGKRLKLTAAGLRFHESCSHAFEILREAQAELDRSKNQRNLSISALPSLLKAWLAPLVFEWQDAHYPDLTIQFKGSHSEPSNDLEDIDFRITYGDTGATSQNSLDLYTDSVVPVCSPALIAPRNTLQSPMEILDYPLLSTDWRPKFTSPPSWQEWFAAYLDDDAGDGHRTEPSGTRRSQAGSRHRPPDGVVIHSHQIFSLSQMTIEAAVAGQGFALAQCSMMAREVATGQLIIPFKLALPLPWPYVLKWKHSAFDRPHCRAFHRWLTTRGKSQGELNRQMLA